MTTNPPQTLDQAQATVGELPATNLPLALFPVRLETRFVTEGATTYLCVRIFPDDVHVETHEPGLTADEERWGRHLWEQVWRTGRVAAAERALQDELAGRFGPGRAAWIARTLAPLNPQARPAAPVPEDKPLPVAPIFPTVASRAESWTRAPQVRALPDRWVLLAYRSTGRVLTAVSEPVRRPLAAGPDPLAPRPASQSDDRITIDPGMQWLVDFETAVQQGMGLRIPLASAAEAYAGYSRVVVLGMKKQNGTEGAPELEALLEAQRYTDSLAFVPQGTPTNNTAEAPAGYAASQPEQWTPFLSATGGATPHPEENRLATARALGLNPAVFDAVPHAGDTEQADARHANTALWPATWGYFLRQVAGGAMTDDEIESTRRHYIDNVRARGPVPALRVGRQPYGILPVTSLDRYTPAAGDALGARGVTLLRALREWWRRSLPGVPRVHPVATAEETAQTLADILGMQPVADHVQTRLAVDGDFHGIHAQRAGLPVASSALHAQRIAQVAGVLRPLGVTQQVLGAFMVFAGAGFRLAERLAGPGGADGKLGTPNFIAAIRAATCGDLQAEQLGGAQGMQTALYLLLRHSMILAYAHTAYRIRVDAGQLQAGSVTEPALVDVHSQGTTATEFFPGPAERSATMLRLLDAPMPGASSGTMRAVIHTLGAANHPRAALLDEMRASLDHLATVRAGWLDALTRETLDLASHRLDAWITSLATARLRRLRQASPTGLLLGGYGWVENLRSTAAGAPIVNPVPPGETIAGSPLYDAPGNGGFVAAPSLTHAATAAILRSGYTSYADGGASTPFAIDLASERVRLAQWLLDGVRQGQPLGALLGYRFERALREGGLPEYIRAFRLIAPFNDLYKLKAEKAELERQRTDLVAAYDTARSALTATITSLQTQIPSLNSQISAKTALQAQLTNEISALNSQIGLKQNEVALLILQRDSLIALINATTNLERKREYQLQLNQVLTQLQNAQTALNGMIASRDQKNAQLATTNTEIANLTAQRNAAQALLPQKIAERDALDQSHTAALTALNVQIAALQGQIQTLEDAYRQKYTATTSLEAMETIEVQHVVDGLALMRKWKANEIVFGVGDLPLPGSADATALAKELDVLVAMVDAVSDLLTAEGVHQLIQGNDLRAGASLDAMARGETPPPQPEVVRTPRSGFAHTHRIAVLLSGAPLAPAAWPLESSYQRRALAEPALNAWVAKLLPDPARVRIDIAYLHPATGATLSRRTLRLNQFGISPLDAVYMSPPDGSSSGSALEELMLWRIIRTAPKGTPATARVRFVYEEEAGWPATDIGFGAFLEAARAARELLTAARPLDARDLERPEESPAASPDTAELKTRADTIAKNFREARTILLKILATNPATLDLALLRQALLRLAWSSMPDAFPKPTLGDTPEDRSAVIAQARVVLEKATLRVAELDTLETSVNRATATPEAQCELDIKRIQLSLGPDFRVLPRFVSANRTELAATFGDSLALQAQDAMASVHWFQGVAQVRDGAGRLATSLSYAEALAGSAAMRFTVGQLPRQSTDRWIALPLDPAADATRPRVSLVVHLPSAFDAAAPMAGLLVDEWVEAVPTARETIGVAFHYDAPGAHAPQSILLAVPPDARPRWELETLEAIVQETLELAKLRSVDPAALAGDAEYGHLLPALYVAYNPAGDTVSTDLSRAALR